MNAEVPVSKKLFLSSTCYDLHDLRARIEAWAQKNEFEPLLSDRANFPVDPQLHRHDVCLANAKSADLFVLLIAGRYGAPYHADPTISITWAEFRAASQSRVPVVIFVDRRVWDERQKRRRDPTAKLAFTSDARTFDLLSEIQDATGYWMEMYEDEAAITARLDNLASLFFVVLHRRRIVRDGKYIRTDSLSDESQHHVRLTVGTNELLGDYDLHTAVSAIPEAAHRTVEVNQALHGFSVYIEKVTETNGGISYLVRPTTTGAEIREELWGAYCLL
jgi:hypothetical protein